MEKTLHDFSELVMMKVTVKAKSILTTSVGESAALLKLCFLFFQKLKHEFATD